MITITEGFYYKYNGTFVELEATEPKWVNPVLNIIGVNSLRLGGFQLCLSITNSRKIQEDCE